MPFLQPLNCEKVKFHAFFGKGEQRGARPSAKADGRMGAAAKPPPAALGEAECGAPRVRGNVGANGGVLLRIWVLRGYQKPPSVRICT